MRKQEAVQKTQSDASRTNVQLRRLGFDACIVAPLYKFKPLCKCQDVLFQQLMAAKGNDHCKGLSRLDRLPMPRVLRSQD